jgi:enoyl-CoA hydratase/carnithine racemase
MTQSHSIGKSLAMEMCLTGARISAEKVYMAGIVSKIFLRNKMGKQII